MAGVARSGRSVLSRRVWLVRRGSIALDGMVTRGAASLARKRGQGSVRLCKVGLGVARPVGLGWVGQASPGPASCRMAWLGRPGLDRHGAFR